mmetsp:Transcript_28023/g.46404  ORF Transcript_28023/g.46404 Transcript_28023/m.46404 type:complete len:80 (+) Transcript_28023:2274-2513(+)
MGTLQVVGNVGFIASIATHTVYCNTASFPLQPIASSFSFSVIWPIVESQPTVGKGRFSCLWCLWAVAGPSPWGEQCKFG